MLHFQTYGTGFPMLLLHGFAEDGNIWQNQIAFLKNHFKLIIPDLPGSGFSPMLDGEIGIDDYANEIKILLDKEGINQCILLGHSMGGYISLAFAEKNPEYLKGLGLIHSTAFADSEEKKQIRLRGIKTIEEYGSFQFLKTTTPNLFADKFKNEKTEILEKFIEEGNNFTKQSLKQYYRAMMQRPDRTMVLKKSKVPVLIIAGLEDRAIPVNDLLQQAHMPQVSYFHILKNVAHMGMWEDPEKTNRLLASFAHEII